MKVSMCQIIGGKKSMKRNDEFKMTEEETRQLDRRNERIHQHAILIANLSASIVKEVRMVSDGMLKDDIINHFADFSVGQIEDALESAIEDEYIEAI
jgi:hypothetical protein